ncbi:hypothetical protein ACPCHT_39170 [Nucisporomicrobium flavum]|uniref:hypothetical protein n=1 Tax=Nucisporomicrobium flavum TaxID=2785915 RepID=UPI003C2F5310
MLAGPDLFGEYTRVPANRTVGQDLVDDADPVEADHDRQPPGDRRGLVAADLLQPSHVAFDLGSAQVQRINFLT